MRLCWRSRYRRASCRLLARGDHSLALAVRGHDAHDASVPCPSRPRGRSERARHGVAGEAMKSGFRVRVGAFASKGAAEKYLKDLARETGAKGFVTNAR